MKTDIQERLLKDLATNDLVCSSTLEQIVGNSNLFQNTLISACKALNLNVRNTDHGFFIYDTGHVIFELHLESKSAHSGLSTYSLVFR